MEYGGACHVCETYDAHVTSHMYETYDAHVTRQIVFSSLLIRIRLLRNFIGLPPPCCSNLAPSEVYKCLAQETPPVDPDGALRANKHMLIHLPDDDQSQDPTHTAWMVTTHKQHFEKGCVWWNENGFVQDLYHQTKEVGARTGEKEGNIEGEGGGGGAKRTEQSVETEWRYRTVWREKDEQHHRDVG